MLERLLAIDERTARTMAQDMLIAGIDTVRIIILIANIAILLGERRNSRALLHD